MILWAIFIKLALAGRRKSWSVPYLYYGGLSTFSAEVVGLIRTADYGWALATASLHLFGSLLMTGLGIWTIHRLAA